MDEPKLKAIGAAQNAISTLTLIDSSEGYPLKKLGLRSFSTATHSIFSRPLSNITQCRYTVLWLV
ncbi:MAG: hypothetical protein PHH47_01635 [Gallionella sp.]|nr:hypothetical protein [Gallionella sp.]MDD4946744.1 hypothetical protein [Gallionella sp.]